MPPPAAIETPPLGNVILPQHPKRSSANDIDDPTHAKRAFYSGAPSPAHLASIVGIREPSGHAASPCPEEPQAYTSSFQADISSLGDIPRNSSMGSLLPADPANPRVACTQSTLSEVGSGPKRHRSHAPFRHAGVPHAGSYNALTSLQVDTGPEQDSSNFAPFSASAAGTYQRSGLHKTTSAAEAAAAAAMTFWHEDTKPGPGSATLLRGYGETGSMTGSSSMAAGAACSMALPCARSFAMGPVPVLAQLAAAQQAAAVQADHAQALALEKGALTSELDALRSESGALRLERDAYALAAKHACVGAAELAARLAAVQQMAASLDEQLQAVVQEKLHAEQMLHAQMKEGQEKLSKVVSEHRAALEAKDALLTEARRAATRRMFANNNIINKAHTMKTQARAQITRLAGNLQQLGMQRAAAQHRVAAVCCDACKGALLRPDLHTSAAAVHAATAAAVAHAPLQSAPLLRGLSLPASSQHTTAQGRQGAMAAAAQTLMRQACSPMQLHKPVPQWQAIGTAAAAAGMPAWAVAIDAANPQQQQPAAAARLLTATVAPAGR